MHGGLSAAAAPAVSAVAAESVFDVSRIEIAYGLPHPMLPPAEDLLRTDVALGLKDGVYVPAETAGASPATLPLASLPAAARLSASALLTVMEHLVSDLNRRGLQVVFVRPDPRQLDIADSVDLREAGDRSLRLIVWVGQIVEVRTIAKGERFRLEESINNPAHARIRNQSPIQPAAENAPGGLFQRPSVDLYVRGLSTHPTRRVEASLASAGEPGKVVLDYLVNEVRPWQVFAQASNTGSKTTGEWRTRLGFQHTQMTNRDDILNLDLVASGQLDTKAGLASYSYPLVRPDSLRLRVFGSVGDFKTDDIGFQQARYTGDNWQAGAELTYRIPMPEAFALAAQAGLTYNHYTVGSSVADFSGMGGKSGFLIPFIGARISRVGDSSVATLGARLEHSVDGVPNESPTSGIGMLGRSEPAASWTVLKAGFSTSSYSNSFFRRGGIAGSAEPRRSLAHEISASVRGQYVLSRDRLVPQEQDLLGGANSVRGYPDSFVAADDSVVSTLEYAFHGGRVAAIRRLVPGELEVTLRAFTDYGYRWVTATPATRGDLRVAERNLSMWGAGVGTDLAWRNVRLRCDVGYALRDVADASITLAEKGDVRAHLLGNVSW